MSDLDRTLRFKAPALVVRARPIAPVETMKKIETIAAPHYRKADLVREVRRLEARGEVRVQSARPRWNQPRGQWEVDVTRLRAPAPAWRKPLLVAVSVLAVLVLLAWAVLTTLAAIPLGVFCGAVLVALGMLARAGRRPAVTVTTTTTMTVR